MQIVGEFSGCRNITYLSLSIGHAITPDLKREVMMLKLEEISHTKGIYKPHKINLGGYTIICLHWDAIGILQELLQQADLLPCGKPTYLSQR